MPGYRIAKQEIDHERGGGFRFRGLSRSIESVKSMHGFTRFWLEEGQFISAENLKILTPTLREEGSELWISANAMNSADPFSQRFIIPYEKEIEKNGYYEDDLHLIVKVNYSDNPWFPVALEQERIHDKEHLSRALYDHIWEGHFNDSVDDAIIKTEWFDAAIDAHVRLGFKARGAKICSHDPSDLGTDDKALTMRHGSVVTECISRSFGDVNSGCDWALDYAIDNGADLFTWDTDGMGAGLKRQVDEGLKGKHMAYKLFYGGAAPERPDEIYERVDGAVKGRQRSNREMFKNRRAQFYWMLRDRFYRTWLAVEKGQYIDPDKLISISSCVTDRKLLRSEVCRIPRKFNNQGTVQILSKPEMLRLKIQSPNLADSLMMSMVDPDIPGDEEPLIFDSLFD